MRAAVGLGVAILVLGALVLGASAAGWLGPLGVCGADRVAVCVTWPRAASFAVWGAPMLLALILAAWQIRQL